MLTLFTTPKPFRGIFNTIQRNAIRSWTLLYPRPEIILVDDVEGSDSVVKEFGLHHIPDVERNEFGTPLVSSIFETGQRAASNRFVCYINADIILTDSFLQGVQSAAQMLSENNFLLIGRRWNVYLKNYWDFEKGDWQERLKKYAIENGYHETAGATDYFVFPKGVNWDIPPFAIGRGAWDGWFLWNACRMGIPVIDATEVITVYHQQHDYSHWKGIKHNSYNYFKSKEFKRNERLRGTFAHQYNIWDSTHILTRGGLQLASSQRWFFANILRLKMCVTYYLHLFHPYSYPLVAFLKTIRKLVKLLKK